MAKMEEGVSLKRMAEHVGLSTGRLKNWARGDGKNKAWLVPALGKRYSFAQIPEIQLAASLTHDGLRGDTVRNVLRDIKALWESDRRNAKVSPSVVSQGPFARATAAVVLGGKRKTVLISYRPLAGGLQVIEHRTGQLLLGLSSETMEISNGERVVVFKSPRQLVDSVTRTAQTG